MLPGELFDHFKGSPFAKGGKYIWVRVISLEDVFIHVTV